MNNLAQKTGSFFLAGIILVGCFVASYYVTEGNELLKTSSVPLRLLAAQGVSALIALGALWLFSRWTPALGFHPPRIGLASRRDWLYGLGAMLVLYTLHHAFVMARDQQQEAWMAQIMAMDWMSFVLLAVVSTTVVPLNEELLFRQVLPGMPAQPLAKLMGATLFRVALAIWLFWFVHTQYEHTSTRLLVGAVGAVCMWARWRTGGLALPIALHGFASALAFGFNALYWGDLGFGAKTPAFSLMGLYKSIT